MALFNIDLLRQVAEYETRLPFQTINPDIRELEKRNLVHRVEFAEPNCPTPRTLSGWRPTSAGLCVINANPAPADGPRE
jgi:hypothetical protein